MPAGPPVHETQILGLIKELRTHLHDVPITAAAAAAVGPSSANGGEAGTGKGSKKGRSKRKKAQPAGTEPGDVEEREEEVGRQGTIRLTLIIIMIIIIIRIITCVPPPHKGK